MKCIIGLGNPDAHFAGTRHNIGFAVLDAFAARHNGEWTRKDKFKATTAEVMVDGQKAILAKPTTYYNLSGDAVRAIAQFYKLENNDILVVHDELDLPYGTLRSRNDGSSAGNNGIKSIIAAIGEDFARLRVGIANEHSGRQDAADFVLGHLSKQENAVLPAITERAGALITSFITDTLLHVTIEV